MSYIYEEVVIDGSTMIKRTSEDGMENYIPPNQENRDYKEYLQYLEETK